MRVFIGVTETAGYYRGLKAGMDELGISATHLDLSHHPFGYAGSPPPNQWARVALWLERHRQRARFRPIRLLWAVVQQAVQLLLLVWAVARFDVFILGGRTLVFGMWDLVLLRRAGKKIIFVTHGSDARPPYLDGYALDLRPRGTPRYWIRLARQQKRRLRWIEKYAHAVVSHPPYAHFLGKPFVPFTWIGIPRPAAPPPGSPASAVRKGPVRILHAPSTTRSKGSEHIRAIVQRLRSRGYNLEFLEISGRPHAEVWSELGCCDFVIDQAYSDTPMAGFAAEAAALGKPSVVGGYAQEECTRVPGAGEIPVSEYCRPEEMERAVERLIQDEAYRRERGDAARRSILERWGRAAVARRLLSVLDPSAVVPRFDPRDIRYVHGYGRTEVQVRAFLRTLLEHGGLDAFGVSDKPELEARLKEFAEG